MTVAAATQPHRRAIRPRAGAQRRRARARHERLRPTRRGPRLCAGQSRTDPGRRRRPSAAGDPGVVLDARLLRVPGRRRARGTAGAARRHRRRAVARAGGARCDGRSPRAAGLDRGDRQAALSLGQAAERSGRRDRQEQRPPSGRHAAAQSRARTRRPGPSSCSTATFISATPACASTAIPAC